MKRWQDWVNAVLGVALIASPWILGFAQARGVAAWGAWILGNRHRPAQ
jgi:urease accessory protein UreE